ARGRVARFDGFAAVVNDEAFRDHDNVLPPAAHDHATPLADGGFQRVVLAHRELGHQAEPHHARIADSRTSAAPSTSARGTYSSLACATAMSPGPKQMAGMPAAVRSAASVQHDSPSTRAGRFRAAMASARHCTTGWDAGTSFGSCENPGAMTPSSSGRTARTRATVASSSRTKSAAASPGIVRRSNWTVHSSGYVERPLPPLMNDAWSEGRP